MEIQSPYLQAIQAIPGTVPGEKYKALNLIAKRIAASTQAHGDSKVIAQISDVPQPLIPLVKLEIANILRQYDNVVEALKSEDSIIINRAMTMRWFFRGDNKDIINVEYFETNLLPYVSLDTRIQLVKRLAMNLRTSGETKIAEKFYTHFARKYGKKQAEPLLAACGESFIYDTVTANKIVLSCRIVRILFLRYADLVIRYMKLSKPSDDEWSRNNYNIKICQYSNFLPRLIKNHLKGFIELLEMHNSSLNIQLSNKATETFLKKNVEALLSKPKLYTELMPLKVIAAKLTKAQYKCMFPKIFPERWQQFNYRAIQNYLEYYPEQERMALVIDSYKEVYNMNFLDNTDAIDVEFLCMLPADERTRQARIKLEKQPDWHSNRYDVTKAWRCYLPIDESIPSIKKEIAKTSSADDRSSLLKQMFYSCKVNDDKDALLEALRYFTIRHKNEQIYLIFEVLDNLTNYFDLSTVRKDHWIVLNDFIQFLHVKNELNTRPTPSKKILAAGVHFNLIHDLPIEDKIAIILEINMNSWNQSWSILEKYPEYDRRCIDTFLSMIPQKYPKDDQIWKDRQLDVVESIMKSMYDFNTRNAKANCKIEKLTIKNYPWLLEAVKTIVQSKHEDMKWKVDSIISILNINEKDLYNEWIIIEEETVANVQSGEALSRLAKNPKNILDNWEEYLKRAQSYVSYTFCAQRFVRMTRWYQEIPIKFVDSCLKKISQDADANSIVVLGILMEGTEFARVIEPLVPTGSKIDTEDKNAKSTYEVIHTIPKAMNLANPPVPLSLVLSFCEGDYLNLGLTSLTNTCRRVSVEKVEPFAKTLVDRRVSVKKHGIRMFCLVASIDDLRTFLSELWKTEKHRSIRAVIFEKIYSLFVNEPNPDTWTIMKNCITNLMVDDDDILDNLMNLSVIPDEYIADYIKQLLETLEKLEAKGFSAERTNGYVSRVLRSIDGSISNLLPEDFCEQLLRKYFCNPGLHVEVSSAGQYYVMHGYLRPAGEKLESRLAVLCNLYEDILKKHWNVPHPKASFYFPVNYLAHNFMTDLINLERQDNNVRSRTIESILKSFLAVLKPECDFVSYALLTYGVVLKDTKTPAEIVAKIGETLPRLVAALSPEIIVSLSDIVNKWIEILVDADKVETVIYDLIESLCQIGTDHACLLASKLLFLSENREFEERRIKIFEFLRESKHPGVVSLVYLHANTRSFAI